jgi:hypothetical protein
MTRIERTEHLRVPHSQAIDLIAAFFKERPQLKVRGIGGSTASVEVRYELLYDWTRLVQSYDAVVFAWNPRWRGFPPFGAILTIEPSGEGSLLVIEGSYEPPGGAAGRFFDRALGARLAARTMDALLRDIARYVEDQVAKKGPG